MKPAGLQSGSVVSIYIDLYCVVETQGDSMIPCLPQSLSARSDSDITKRRISL
jgi:hypothetical protein